MTRYLGNNEVGTGLYLSPRNLRVAALEDGQRLPGSATASWYLDRREKSSRTPGTKL